MNLRDTLADGFLKSMNLSHQAILRLSGGRVLSSAFGMPAVELETTGRKSGLRRTTMLTAPVVDGERVVLVASKGGDDRDPDWFRNLVAHPEVAVTMNGSRREMVARVASPEEKAELWPRIVASYRGYAGYQRRTNRDIPVVIFEPPAGERGP
jgi:deazaflavin-dependent oxidoreductase (nitroreductase family)